MNYNVINKIADKILLTVFRDKILGHLEYNFLPIHAYNFEFLSLAYIDMMNYKKNMECKSCNVSFGTKPEYLRHIWSLHGESNELSHTYGLIRKRRWLLHSYLIEYIVSDRTRLKECIVNIGDDFLI